MGLIAKATNLLVFINQLTPELTKLFDSRKGDVVTAKRDLQSLLPEIEREELRIDLELAVQEAQEEAKSVAPGRKHNAPSDDDSEPDDEGDADAPFDNNDPS
jgi:hypothetical protein